MRFRRSAIGKSVIALSVIAAVLAAAFAVTEIQFSDFMQSAHSYCSHVNAAISRVSVAFANITQTLQQQVKSDNSMIATLNSTKPVGYEGMMATLNTQVTQDLAIIDQFSVSDHLSPVNDFCPLVN
jgi:hypothetical protein